MSNMTTELQQTKGTFKLIGKVTNIDRENNYVEKIAERETEKETHNVNFALE